VRLASAVKEEEDFHMDSEVRCEGAHPLCGVLSRRGLNIIKLAYDPQSHVGRIATSVFNQLWHYASSPGNIAYCYAELL